MCSMPKPYPKEFRDDVMRVARNPEPTASEADRRRLRHQRVVSNEPAEGRRRPGRRQARGDGS